MSNTSATTHYPWKQPGDPDDGSRARLRVHNSLTGNLTPFIPHCGLNTNLIKWYICGPTVYNSSHVGHASNYVRFDIVRRILSDYFGYNVVVQMNITDIDDKIINKANEGGETFDKVARKYEAEFLKDMRDLNVRDADFVTRVSDYVEEIIAYIGRIVKNGYAYESNGSVYFDLDAFVNAGHNYGKVEPKSVGNAELLAEGEGALTNTENIVRKSKNDFVLWKKSKEGEPKWESPWGLGRPGWHIECSAMAEAVLGKDIDFHAGGVDLRFPHHSNEIAQAEAFHDSDQWVNYWLHSGHLHIDGRKMSKSLKNFKTIQEVLERFNARQLRIAFLKSRYSSPITYDEEAMTEAVNLDRSFVDFFGALKAAIRAAEKVADPVTRPSEAEYRLSLEVEKTQVAVSAALADDFNTPVALQELLELIRSCNTYMKSVSDDRYNAVVLASLGRYVAKMFRIFGLTSGQGEELEYGGRGEGNQSKEAILGPIISTFAEYRDVVRRKARMDVQNQVCKDILKLSDEVRDDVLPHLGIRLEDRGPEKSSTWKLEDSRALLAEIRRKKDEEEEKKIAKEKREAARKEKERKALEQGRTSPDVMFRIGEYQGKFSEFDDNGMPTKFTDGSELPKAAKKRFAKARDKQTKLHNQYLKALEECRISAD